ncbi:MAG: sulfurtransferase TusA family protein [Chloroflexi bacterium]|nr:sulfurtransferase TusA family protein [Chloroflexota bacterium]
MSEKVESGNTGPVKADQVIDLKGLLCPMPVVKLSIAVKKLPTGAVVEGIATDPGVMADIPAWARTSGNELISIDQQGKEYHFVVRKVK